MNRALLLVKSARAIPPRAGRGRPNIEQLETRRLFASAIHLVFLQQPGTSTLGSAVTPTVMVAVEDTNGNIVTTDNSFITLSIASGPGGASLGGGVTINANQGVASFTSLTPSEVGTYTLLATDIPATPATSAPFQVVNAIGARATTTQIASNDNPATVGDTVSFTATVTGPGGTPTGNVQFFDGSAPLGLQALGPNGTATLAVPNLPAGNHSIFATYLGDATFLSSNSVAIAQLVSSAQSNTDPNLVTTVSGTQPLVFVPGNTGSVSVTIMNQGMGLAKGVVGIQLFASPDGLLADGILLPTPALPVALQLRGQTYRTIRMSFTVPSDFAPGTYSLLAKATPIRGITPSDISSAPVTGGNAPQATFSLSFGSVGGRRGIKLVRTDANGTVATYRLSGPGAGTLVGNVASTPTVVLTGTTAGSIVSITTRGGSGGLTLAGLSADSAVGVINAPTTVLTGVLSIAGANQQLVLSSITNSNLAASSFGSVIIQGGIDQSRLLAGTSFGADGAPGGGDDTFIAGRIRSLRILGSVTASVIAAGLNPVDGIYLNGNDTLITGGQINTVSVVGTVSADSRILAAILPRTAVLNRAAVATASDPRFAL